MPHGCWGVVDGRGPHIQLLETLEAMCIVCGFTVPCAIEAWIAWFGDSAWPHRKRDVVPRPERLCRLCSTVGAPFYGQRQGEAGVEDVKHFVLECPAYGHIRSRYSDVFGVAPDVCMDMLAIFDTDHQDQLAHAVYTMTKFRDQCLLCPQGAVITVDTLQLVVEEDVELLRMS